MNKMHIRCVKIKIKFIEKWLLEIEDIDKSFGKNNVISKFNLQVEKGEFLVLLGPSDVKNQLY